MHYVQTRIIFFPFHSNMMYLLLSAIKLRPKSHQMYFDIKLMETKNTYKSKHSLTSLSREC